MSRSTGKFTDKVRQGVQLHRPLVESRPCFVVVAVIVVVVGVVLISDVPDSQILLSGRSRTVQARSRAGYSAG